VVKGRAIFWHGTGPKITPPADCDEKPTWEGHDPTTSSCITEGFHVPPTKSICASVASPQKANSASTLWRMDRTNLNRAKLAARPAILPSQAMDLHRQGHQLADVRGASSAPWISFSERSTR